MICILLVIIHKRLVNVPLRKLIQQTIFHPEVKQLVVVEAEVLVELGAVLSQGIRVRHQVP